MALGTLTLSTADLGLGTAATAWAITLDSAQPYLTNGSADIQRTKSGTTAADGTASVPIEGNAGLSDTASTYTVTLGANRYSGVAFPNDGGAHSLLSLLPAVTVRTVLVTQRVWDPGDAPVPGVQVTARLSIDCTNLDGVTILAARSIAGSVDSSGLASLALERTDQLTPTSGAGEPYYTIVIGGSTYSRTIHGAGTLLGQPAALPTSSTGSFAATEAAIATGAPRVLHHAAPATALDDLEELRYQIALLRLRGTAGVATLGPFGTFL